MAGFPVLAISTREAERVMGNAPDLLSILSPYEADVFGTLINEKRRNDWLAGRIAGKYLLRFLVERAGLELPSLASAEIITDGQPPHLVLNVSLPEPVRAILAHWHLSLSHTEGMAIAAADRSPMGVDIEHRRPLGDSVVSGFLRSDEAQLLPGEEPIALWTAKEAVAKAVGKGFGLGDFQKVRLNGFELHEEYEAEFVPQKTIFRCVTFQDREYVVSLATTSNPVDEKEIWE